MIQYEAREVEVNFTDDDENVRSIRMDALIEYAADYMSVEDMGYTINFLSIDGDQYESDEVSILYTDGIDQTVADFEMFGVIDGHEVKGIIA